MNCISAARYINSIRTWCHDTRCVSQVSRVHVLLWVLMIYNCTILCPRGSVNMASDLLRKANLVPLAKATSEVRKFFGFKSTGGIISNADEVCNW